MDDLTTECSFDSQATWVIDVLDLFHDMLSNKGCGSFYWICTSRLTFNLPSIKTNEMFAHWRTNSFGRIIGKKTLIGGLNDSTK